MLGTNLTVLINNKPTARCGDYGLNPTCCGVVPPLSALYEIVTGSSNVYIGGSRAARSGIDITMHCFNMPSPKMSIKLGKLAGIASKVGKAAGVAGKVAGAAGRVAGVAGMVARPPRSRHPSPKLKPTTTPPWRCDRHERCDDGRTSRRRCRRRAMTKMIGTDQPEIPPIGTPGHDPHGFPQRHDRRLSVAVLFRDRPGAAETGEGTEVHGWRGEGAPLWELYPDQRER